MITEANYLQRDSFNQFQLCARDVFYDEPLVHPRDFDDRAPLVLRTRTGCPVSPIDLSSETIYEGELPWSSSQSTEKWWIELATIQKMECPEAGRACRPIYDT